MQPFELDVAVGLTEQTILNDLRHANYKRVVEVAKFARQFMTGKDHEEILKQFRHRETEDMMKQRVRLYQAPTPGILSPVEAMFDRVRHLAAETKKGWTDVGGKNGEWLKMAELEPWEGQDLQSYLFDVISFYTFYDPNALIYIAQKRQFNRSGEAVEDVKIYPVEISSEQAINYETQQGKLQWLIYEQKRKEENRPVSDFFFTAPGIELVYREYIKQVPEVLGNPVSNETVKLVKSKGGKERLFLKMVYETGTEEVPAFILGAYPDGETKYTSYLPPYWKGLQVLMESIRDKSFQDCNIPEHYFPRQFHLAPKCNHVDEEWGPCVDGFHQGNKVCKMCNGKGHNLHISEQDRVIIALPESGMELPDLSKLIYWHLPAEWLPRWMDERLKELRRTFFFQVFNSEPTERPTGATATEVNINYEAVQTKLQPYAKLISDTYKKYIRVAAQYVEAWEPGFEVTHNFPSDLRLETMAELMDMLEKAKSNGAAFPVIQSIQKKLISKQHADQPEETRTYLAFEYHVPWKDKDPAQIMTIINRRDREDFEVFLWENADQVLNMIKELVPQFADMTRDVQRLEIEKVVQEMQSKVKFTELAPLDPFGERVSDQSPDDENQSNQDQSGNGPEGNQ